MRRTRVDPAQTAREERWFRNGAGRVVAEDDPQPRRASLAVAGVVQAEIRANMTINPCAIFPLRFCSACLCYD